MRRGESLRETDDFIHHDHPLVQQVRAVRGFLLPAEHEEIERLLPDRGDDVIVERSPHGFALYGRSEAAMICVAKALSGSRWQHLALDPLQARSRAEPARVAWMHVHVKTPRSFVALIKDELFRRGGCTRRSDLFGDVAMISAAAPLAEILGYPEWVTRRTVGKASVTTRLAEWRGVDEEPDPSEPLAA